MNPYTKILHKYFFKISTFLQKNKQDFGVNIFLNFISVLRVHKHLKKEQNSSWGLCAFVGKKKSLRDYISSGREQI